MKQATGLKNDGEGAQGRLLYLQLLVEDLERSLAFYTGPLGMRLLSRQDYTDAHISLGFVGYQDNDDATMLGLRHDWGRRLPKRGEELGPIALGVPDWETVVTQLETAGIALHRPSARTTDGAHIALLHDPDGYPIELIEELESDRLKIEARKESGVLPLEAPLQDFALQNSSTEDTARHSIPPTPSPISAPPPATKRKDTARERILEAAGRGFRLRGYGGIGVDGLAKEAGVTSGAFYGHFRSKEEAFQAAVTTGLDDFRAGVERFRAEQGEEWVRVFAQWYLGKAYLEDIAGSCALPSLSPDVVRADGAVRHAYEMELRRLAQAVAEGLPVPNSSPSVAHTRERQEHDAWIFLAMLVGGVTLARAVEDPDLELRIASAVRDAVIALGTQEPRPFG